MEAILTNLETGEEFCKADMKPQEILDADKALLEKTDFEFGWMTKEEIKQCKKCLKYKCSCKKFHKDSYWDWEELNKFYGKCMTTGTDNFWITGT